MKDAEVQDTFTVGIRDLRNRARDVLDGTQFLGHRYIITTHGKPMAQLAPPTMNDPVKSITVTDLRVRTKAILEAVHFSGKVFLVLRHEQAAAILQPLQPCPGDPPDAPPKTHVTRSDV